MRIPDIIAGVRATPEIAGRKMRIEVGSGVHIAICPSAGVATAGRTPGRAARALRRRIALAQNVSS